jgi:serine/threonine protein kinase
MPDQIPMPKTVKSRLETEMFGKQIAGFTIREVLGAGNTAITYGAEDRYGQTWALKLVTHESYGDRPPFREVARFAQAADKRFLVFPEETGDWELLEGKKSVQFIWFRSRCVRGKSLESFLHSNLSFSPLTEVRRFIENLAVALDQLKQIGFSHGDLHSRNIMREVVGEGGPVPEVRYVVIDFSEAHPVENAQEGLLEDLEVFGQHLRSFSDWIHRRDDISREDEKVLKAIEHLPGLLNGLTAETVRLWNPTEILRTFLEGLRSAEEAPKKLRTPFDSLSAENITNDALLAKLCFTDNWWAAELEKPGNVLLVGPRGCGKSMIFRRHRLKTKIAAQRIKELKSDAYVGFYLPCESLFYDRISDLSDAIVERYGDALLFFSIWLSPQNVRRPCLCFPTFLAQSHRPQRKH